MRRKPTKHTNKPNPTQRPPVSSKFDKLSDQVRDLIKAEEYEDAYALLDANETAVRSDTRLCSAMILVCHELDTPLESLTYALAQYALWPSFESSLQLGMSYSQNDYVGLALQTLAPLPTQRPDFPGMHEIKDIITELQAEVDERIRNLGMPTEQALEVVLQEERVISLISTDDLDGAKRAAYEFVKKAPDLAQAHHLVSSACFMLGDVTGATESAIRCLSIDPQNVEALCVLLSVYQLTGDSEAAVRSSAQLKQRPIQSSWTAGQIAQALCRVGDYRGILELQSRFNASKRDTDPEDPRLLHCSAVALAREGRDEEARLLFESVLELDPDMDIALENLKELDRDAEIRAPAWGVESSTWMLPPAWRAIELCVLQVGMVSAEALQRSSRSLLRKHPEIVHISPWIMNHADPLTIGIIFKLAVMSSDEQLAPVLQDFINSGKAERFANRLLANLPADPE